MDSFHFTARNEGHLRGTGAANEVVAAGTGVGDGTGVVAVSVDDDTVSTGGACTEEVRERKL